MKIRWVLLGAVAISLLLVGTAMALGSVDWWVIGGGGGSGTGGGMSLNGTIGQPLVGSVSQSDYWLCSGFWCDAQQILATYLPLVIKDF